MDYVFDPSEIFCYWVPQSGLGHTLMTFYWVNATRPLLLTWRCWLQSFLSLSPSGAKPFLFVQMNHKFPTKFQQQAALFLFYSRKTPKTVSSKEEKAPCSGNPALNIFALKIDLIFTQGNAVHSYLFRSQECEIHRGGACKNKEKTALKAVQV